MTLTERIEAVRALTAAVQRLATAAPLATTPAALAGVITACDAVISDGNTMLRDAETVDAVAFASNPTEFLDAATWRCETRWQVRRQLVAVATIRDSAAEALRKAGPPRRAHVVLAGETLQSIAATRPRDWRRWPEIAEANGLDPGLPLTVGGSLQLPEGEVTA